MQIRKIIPLLGCFALLCLVHCVNKSERISQNNCEDFPRLNKADSMVRANKLPNKPWIICNANQLKLIQGFTSSVYDVQDEYILARNIDFGGKDVTPIGNFLGTFDGNGRTISNFNIVPETPTIGFFQQIGSASAPGRVINLVLAQATIKVTSSTAIIYAGILAGRLQHKDSVISDVTISSGSVSGNTTSTHAHYLGGLIGHADNGTIINGSAHISIVNGGFEYDRMGGLVGQSEGSATIDNSTATGNVSHGDAGADYMGGLVGRSEGSATIDNSTSTGNVSHGGDREDRMGGLVGETGGTSMVQNSIATGNVSNGGVDRDFMGGLVGRTYGDTKIDNSSATGNVSNGGDGEDFMGGLVGITYNDTTINSSSATGNVSNGGVDRDFMGGLVGRSENDTTINNSSATGNVFNGGADVDHMGGLVGEIYGSSSVTMQHPMIQNSTATGDVSDGGAGGDFMGGLVGKCGVNSNIRRSIATGNVSNGAGEKDYMGGLAGQVIENTKIYSSIATGNVFDGGDANDRMGGLLGETGGGTGTPTPMVQSSIATGNVSHGDLGDDRMGGLVGLMYDSSMVQNSIATGDVSQGDAGEDRMGGLVGEFEGNSTIQRSIASGDVFSGGVDIDVMGGLIGLQENNTNTFEDCIATGDVRLGDDGAAAASTIPMYSSQCTTTNALDANNALGGLVGYAEGGTNPMQLRSYALGHVNSSNDNLGGLFGCFVGPSSSPFASITDLYWNSDTSGLSSTTTSSEAIGNQTTCLSADGCIAQDSSTLIMSATSPPEPPNHSMNPNNLPNLAHYNPPRWNYGGTAKYPGLIFTSTHTSTMGQTCTVRPILTGGSGTSILAEFTICPVEVNVNSFHPMCRAKPLGCP